MSDRNPFQLFNTTITPPPPGSITITYEYDDLYRLTEANYDNGDYYHYSYDAVGNRETQDRFISGLLSNTAYDYGQCQPLDLC